MASVATDQQADAVPNPTVSKRQACDECRSRKLACTKEATGCLRCIRKNVPCHYSEQKPMGRPRKRQCVVEPTDKHVKVLDLDLDPNSVHPQLQETLDFSPGLLNAGFGIVTEESLPLGVVDNLRNENAYTVKEGGRLVWHFGQHDAMPQIDFAENEPVPELDNTPRDTPPDSNIWPGFEHYPHTPSEKCSCLASLYLALASLQDLSNTIPGAVCIVRRATVTAQATLNCPQCTGMTLPLSMVYTELPPIQGFQSFMMLGTLIPVIADGYKRILQMIDCEANSASLLDIKMSLSQYEFQIPPEMGNYTECCPLDGEDIKNLSPSVWRTTLRAFLRWDVYGSTDFMPSAGLKGLVTQMENTCKARHECLVRMREELQLDPSLPPFPADKDRLCTKVLDAAKTAMNDLIIP